MTVRIVTDSTADLPERLVREFGITVVPLNIHFGEEVLKDGVDIWSEEFYHRLQNDPLLPNTSQPSPGEFLQVYRQLSETGDPIISLHISRELSGTCGSAEVAAAMLNENTAKSGGNVAMPGEATRIHVVDSRSVSMGLGLIALEAARLAASGAAPAEILRRVAQWQAGVKILFTVNNLEFLARNGRIGKAAEFVGSLLNIKPILGVEDGVIVPLERLRGNCQKVIARMIERLETECDGRPVRLCILHTDLPELGNYMSAAVKAQLNVVECYQAVVGPVVGSHSGPSTYGIAVLPADGPP